VFVSNSFKKYLGNFYGEVLGMEGALLGWGGIKFFYLKTVVISSVISKFRKSHIEWFGAL
jgi:hypothetical protein